MKGWLSRSAHEEIVAVYKERAASAEAARAADANRHHAAYQDLLARYQSLVERSAKGVGVPVTIETEQPEPDLIQQAAYERWGTDPGAMMYVNRFIAEQRAKAARGDPDAMDERAILEKVLYGVSASEGVEF
jgi:ParB-like chromosome segregation protein Spo0J